MKSDWFGVLYEIKNISIDENLAYELDVFFKDFVFLKKQNDSIILRCLKNDNDYELMQDKNSIILKYDYKDSEKSYFIEEKINIHCRASKKYIDTNKIIDSNKSYFKSLITIKQVYNKYPLTEIIKRRTFYQGNFDNESKKNFNGDFVETGNNDYEFKIRVNYEKINLENSIKAKYIIPDIIVGSEVFRNKYDTFLRASRIIQGFNCTDDYSQIDNSSPIALLADETALNYFRMQIENDNINIYKKKYKKQNKRKIGF